MLPFEQEHFDRIDSRLRPLLHRVAEATVPLCQPAPGGGLAAAGSGILLAVADSRYLLTASHCFDPAYPDRRIGMITEEGIVAVDQLPRWRTKVPADISGRVDRVDMAVVDVSVAMPVPLRGTRFLALSEVEPAVTSVDSDPRTGFLLLGYARSKQPRNARGAAYSPVAHHFITHTEPISPDNDFGGSDEYHIAVGYDRRDFIGVPGLSELAHPEGMSGSGVWRVPLALRAAHPEGQLVGIVIEFHPRAKVILASRIRETIRFLATRSPSNASALAARFPDQFPLAA